MQEQNVTSTEQAGYAIAEWCKLVSISRPKLYQLPPELQPSSVKLGRRRIIDEGPRDWLKRIGSLTAKKA